MDKKRAFTLVELLISMTVIVILIGLLLPSFAMVRKMAKETAQKAQFATIDMALDAFKQDYGDYPPSNNREGITSGRFYVGAQKFTEALLGWDLRGFDPNTVWRRDGYTGIVTATGPDSYDPGGVRGDDTLFERRGPYLEVAKTPVFRLGLSQVGANDGLYNTTTFTNFDGTQNNYVICDVFGVKKITVNVPGSTQSFTHNAGSPVLYYKANASSKSMIDAATNKRIYDSADNIQLINLGKLPKGGQHKLETNQDGAYGGTSGRYFYSSDYKIIDEKIYSSSGGTQLWPHRPDTYILISAGADHEFGTDDDILNF